MFSEIARLLGLKTSRKSKQVLDHNKHKEPEKTIDNEPVEDLLPVAIEPIAEVCEKPKKTIVNKSRNGVPVLSKDFDFSAVFTEEIDDKETNGIESKKPINIPEKTLDNNGLNTVPVKKNYALKKDRKGIPVFSPAHDLEYLLVHGIEKTERTELLHTQNKKIFEKPDRKALKDKNKIPILSETIDLTTAFGHDPEKEEFHELLSRNLEGKSQKALLREKKEKTDGPKPIPVEQRIKRYPGPQESLDLHGFTGMEADRKTDIFIRSARRRGLFTVKIIVGKGIHSQGLAVLPDVVEDRLSALKNEREIITFRWEKRLKAQSGSVIAYLRQYD